MEWLWDFLSSIASNLVSHWIIVSGVGAAVFGFLALKKSTLLGPLSYAAGGFCAVAVVLACAKVLMGPIALKPDQLREQVKQWCYVFGFAPKPFLDESAWFAIEGKLGNETAVFVMLPRDRDRYLLIQVQMDFGEPLKEILAKLSIERRQQVRETVIYSLAATKVGYNVDWEKSRLLIVRRVPILDLSESTFIDRVDEVHSAVNVVRTAFGSSARNAFAEQERSEKTKRN